MFHSKIGDTPGVYLWTFEIAGKNWINYVGIHRHSMLQRNEEHLRLFLGGRYTVYCVEAMKRGEKAIAYCGAARMQKFLKDYDNRHTQTVAQLENMRLYFAEFSHQLDVSTLKRVESSIIRLLRKSADTNLFFDNVRLSVNIANPDIEVSFLGAEEIYGLPSSVYA